MQCCQSRASPDPGRASPLLSSHCVSVAAVPVTSSGAQSFSRAGYWVCVQNTCFLIKGYCLLDVEGGNNGPFGWMFLPE